MLNKFSAAVLGGILLVVSACSSESKALVVPPVKAAAPEPLPATRVSDPAKQAKAVRECGASDRTPASRYVVSESEIRDTKKGITWMRCAVGQSWVEGSGCVGQMKAPGLDQVSAEIPNGWRLPNLPEVVTLGEICYASEANRQVFSNISIEVGLGFWVSDAGVNSGAPIAVSPRGNTNSVNIAQKQALIRLVKKD